MSTRWVVAAAAALALGMLTLPGTPGFSIHAGGLLPGAASAQGAACDANAKPANLDFTLPEMDGGEVNLAELKGNVIIINFWATWCGPCKIEIPWFADFQRQYRDDGLVVLGFSVDDTAEQMKPFAEELGVNYPMLVGLGRDDFQEAYGPVWGIPVTFFIDREGTLCRTHMGIVTRDELQKDIEDLL